MFSVFASPVNTIRTKQLIVCETIEYDDVVVFKTSDLVLCFTLIQIDFVIKCILSFEIREKIVNFSRLLDDLC
jgi:hypothetical protein